MMVSEESFGFWWGKKSNHFEIIKIFFDILYINKLSMKWTIKLMDNENICCGKCCVCVLLNSNSVGFCQKNRTHKTNSKQTWAVTKAAAFASWIIAPAWQMFGLHRVSYSQEIPAKNLSLKLFSQSRCSLLPPLSHFKCCPHNLH